VHDAAMAGAVDSLPGPRNILGDHPKSFIPGPLPPIPWGKPEKKVIIQKPLDVLSEAKKEAEVAKKEATK